MLSSIFFRRNAVCPDAAARSGAEVTPGGGLKHAPGHYIAIDSRGRVWRGLVITKSGGPIAIKWAPIPSEFPRRSEPAKLYGRAEQEEEDE